jgi:hypothetical protein
MAASPPDAELVVRTHLLRTDVADRVRAVVSSPGMSLRLPEAARLEYEIFLNPDNASFATSVDLLTTEGPLQNFGAKDQNGHPAGPPPQALAAGKWYARIIALDKLAGKSVQEVIVDGCMAMPPRKVGPNEIGVRGLRIVDSQGKTLWSFDATPSSVGWPLPITEGYTPEIRLESAGLVAGNFMPDRYLLPETESLGGEIEIHNFDPTEPHPIAYQFDLLVLENADGSAPAAHDQSVFTTSGDVVVPPLQTVRVPVTLPRLAAAHYRPILRLDAGGREGANQGNAVSVLTAAAFAARNAPFTPGGFGMGVVPISGGGSEYVMPALREQGGNYFQLRLDWASIEPRPGEYDVERPARYIAMAKACGMKLQIDFYSGYPSHTVPSWYRSQQMETNTGDFTGGPFVPIGYFTQAREAGLRAFKALTDRYGDDDTVISWNAWIAGNMDAFYGLKHNRERLQLMDYSSSAREHFRIYLRDERGFTLATLADRYGRPAPFGKWEDIDPPQPLTDRIDLSPQWADFMDFRRWAVGYVQAEAAHALLASDKDAEMEFLYGGDLGQIEIGNDFDQGVKNARRFGGSLHQTSSPGALTNAYLGGARREFGVPFSIETAGTPALVPAHQKAMFELITEGASAFTWIQSGGVQTLPSPEHGFGELRPALERLSGSMSVDPSIALLHSYSSKLIDIFGRQLDSHRLSTELAEHLEKEGRSFSVFTDGTTDVPWDKFPVVIDGFSESLARQSVDPLIKYVHEGGRLVLFSSTGRYTPGEPDTRYALLRALGAGPKESMGVSIGTPKATFAADGPLAGTSVGLTRLRPLETLPASASVWAVDAAGRPAVVSWPFGKGQVLLWTGWPDPSSPAYAQILDTFAQQTPSSHGETENVRWRLLHKGDSTFLVLFNQRPMPVVAKVTFPRAVTKSWKYGYDLVNETEVTPPVMSIDAANGESKLSHAMRPYEVTVIEFSGKPIVPITRDFPKRTRQVGIPPGAVSGDVLTPVTDSTMALDLKVPASGLYDLSMVVRAPSQSTSLRITDGNGELLLSKAPLASVPQELRFPKLLAQNSGLHLNISTDPAALLTTDWVLAAPVLDPVRSVYVSEAMDNPAPFPGPNYSVETQSEKMALSAEGVTSLCWKKLISETGFYDLSQLTGRNGGILTLAWEENSEEERVGLLVFGVDYGLKLWVNGTLQFDSVKDRPLRGAPSSDEFILPIPLRKGSNQLVAKVAAGSGGWRVWLACARQ